MLLAVIELLALLEGALRKDLPWRVLSVVLVVGLAPLLLWRRAKPLLVVVIAFTALELASVTAGSNTPQSWTAVFILVLPYALVRWGSGREVVLGLAVILAKVAVSTGLGYLTGSNAVAGVAILSAAGALGAALRYRARARARTLEQVKLLERERLARDLHDTVAHHVSAIAIRAQAGLATAALDPGAATDALRVIEAEASRTLAEMRSMVRVLRRNEPAERAPNPRVPDLRQLAGPARAGPAVDVEILGDLDDLPAAVDSAIYRLAQESVTNARRHARQATRIMVRVAADDAFVHLRVSDDGELGDVGEAGGSGGAPGSEGSPGYGLIGMIERVNLLGGSCVAGPDSDRGWTVTAELPRGGWAS
jgi:signal transduction histidine kinase